MNAGCAYKICWEIFMFKKLFVSIFILCSISSNIFAGNSENPFAKNNVLEVGDNAHWQIDKDSGQAVKTSAENEGAYYHLGFDNKQIRLYVSSDTAGKKPKKFSGFEILNVEIDGQQSSVFKWCLNNQQRHNRFLQQGLNVKSSVCVVDGAAGAFNMRLNKDTLVLLQKSSRLEITIKPYRTPLVLSFDTSDFKDMYMALNAKATVSAPVAVKAAPTSVKKPVAVKKCQVSAPAQYKNIKSLEYNCANTAAKRTAEASIAKQVNSENEKAKKLAAEKEKQRKLAEAKKKKQVAEQLEKERILAAEAVALAASEAKQVAIGGEIAQKMIKVCEKYWNKGEHRCYCQKYIESAPAEIQASSTCE